jgi:hypothetical protein
MATTVPNNPFDTQQPNSPAAPNTGIVNTAMTPTGNLSQTAPQVNTLPSNVGATQPVAPNIATYAPTQRTVDRPTETTQGQVESILSKDSPLMQRARALAKQGMAQRGLVNSSMSQGAGVAAMIDRATPIAAQDAQTFSQAASENMNALNQSGQFNATEINRFGLQAAQQTFQGAQADLDRALQVSMQDKSIGAQQSLQAAQQEYQKAENALDRANQQSMQAASLGTQASVAQMQMQFQATQAQLDRENQFKMTEFQNNLQNANVSKAFATDVARGTLATINGIQADPNLTPDAKKAAVQNVIDTGNSTMQWGSTFYNTNLPTIAAPSATASTLNPGGSYQAGSGATGGAASNKPAWQQYLDINTDVAKKFGYSQDAAIRHYQQYGFKENRGGVTDAFRAML